MSDGFLSQEEIDSLLNGGSTPSKDSNDSNNNSSNNNTNDNGKKDDNKKGAESNKVLTDLERDVLGEVGNISMGSASTVLSTLLNQPVNITTPVVKIGTLSNLKAQFEVPNVALDVKFISGIEGENLLVIKVPDASVIANLMMGGDGKVSTSSDNLSEIEISAVSEAMNQMIGSAATSMATMFAREVNISPPNCRIWNESTTHLADNIKDDEETIMVSFKLTIGDLVDSSIMQILPWDTGEKIVSIMTSGPKNEDTEQVQNKEVESAAPQKPLDTPKMKPEVKETYVSPAPTYEEPVKERPKPQRQNQVEVHQAAFQPLREAAVQSAPKNIDLILDVPLEISVVLGRTKKSIKEILNFGTGSLIELDKLAEEPVEIMVNGKKVAYGEVVVVDENFGVRITNIVNNVEKVKSLGK